MKEKNIQRIWQSLCSESDYVFFPQMRSEITFQKAHRTPRKELLKTLDELKLNMRMTSAFEDVKELLEKGDKSKLVEFYRTHSYPDEQQNIIEKLIVLDFINNEPMRTHNLVDDFTITEVPVSGVYVLAHEPVFRKTSIENGVCIDFSIERDNAPCYRVEMMDPHNLAANNMFNCYTSTLQEAIMLEESNIGKEAWEYFASNHLLI